MSLSFDKKTVAILVLIILGVAFFLSLDGEKNIQEATVFEFNTEVYSEQTILGEGYQTFTHPTFAFSVEYPSAFVTEAYNERDGGETIVFQTSEEDPLISFLRKSSGQAGQEKLGFQIFISPFGEDEVITRERILQDVPFVTIDEPQEVIVGDAIRALIFWSEDPLIGKTREVWFIYGGNLYEITTYAHLDSWLARILSSWRFEN